MNVIERDVARLGKGAGVALGGRVVGRGFDLVSQILLARLLGPAGLGLYAIGQAILRIAILVATLGLQHACLRFVPQLRTAAERRRLVRTSVLLAIATGAAIGGALYLAAPFVAATIFGKSELAWVLRAFGVALPLFAGLRVAAAATRSSQRMRYSVYAEELGQPALNVFLFLGLYALGWRLGGALLAVVLSAAAALALAGYYVLRLFPRGAPGEDRDGGGIPVATLLAFGTAAALAGVLGSLNVWIDRLFVGALRSAAEAGIYQAASQLPLVFNVILNGFGAIFTPMIADLYHRREHRRLETMFRVSTKWSLYVSIPLFLSLLFYPGQLLELVFDSRYREGAAVLAVLAVAQMINVATGSVGFLLIMTGHQRRWLTISAVSLAVNVAANALLIPRLGLLGAALATGAAIAFMFLGGLIGVRRTLALWPWDRRYLKGLAAALAAVAVVAGTIFVPLPFGELARPLWGLVLATLTFAGVLIMLGIDPEDRIVISLVESKIFRSKAHDR